MNNVTALQETPEYVANIKLLPTLRVRFRANVRNFELLVRYRKNLEEPASEEGFFSALSDALNIFDASSDEDNTMPLGVRTFIRNNRDHFSSFNAELDVLENELKESSNNALHQKSKFQFLQEAISSEMSKKEEIDNLLKTVEASLLSST